ncbi:MAG: beta-lactamase family protein [bacterium]|nr:beta-lactamase family protein [bacterium]
MQSNFLQLSSRLVTFRMILTLTIIMLTAIQARAGGVVLQDGRLSKLRAEIIASVNSDEVPSLAVAVAQDGRVIWSEAFGWADRENKVPATTSTIYAVGSLSKSITATGLMVLVDRGQIDLDDSVYEYLGDAAPADYLGASELLKVKHIVTMTGGIAHLWLQPTSDDSGPPTPTAAELISCYGSSMFPVGTLFNYSNLSFAYPELLISTVTGLGFSAFMDSEVFTPLGMINSTVELHLEHRAQLAQGYDETGAPLDRDVVFYPKGGGGLYTSIDDLIRYGQFHLQELDGADIAIIRPATVARIHQADDPELPSYQRYSNGWGRFEIGGQLVLISDGRIAGANSMLLLLPQARIAIACLVNASGATSMMKVMQIADTLEPGFMAAAMEFIGSMEAAESPSVAFAVTPELAGIWRGSIRTSTNEIPLTMEFTLGDSVVVGLGGEATVALDYPQYVDRPDTVVHGVKFPYRILTGSFDGEIDTKHTRDLDHYVSLRLRRHAGKFVGEASAIGEGFKLPFYLELEKSE